VVAQPTNQTADPLMGPTWILFKPLASDIPDSVRYRAMLKAALRAHGLKAVRISAVGPVPEAARVETRPTDQGL
jgi:hypothetical protein